MPRTGNSASVGRQSSLRRGAHERQGSGRRLYGVRWLQMAAELLRHGVFLDKDRAPRRASAWAFLLDGTEHGSFFGVELCRPQTLPQRQTLGRRRMGNVLQLQSLRDGGVGGFRVAPARNVSPSTTGVLSNLCIVISQRIVVLPQVRWSLEDAGRLDASQRANRKGLSSFTRSCGEKTLS